MSDCSQDKKNAFLYQNEMAPNNFMTLSNFINKDPSVSIAKAGLLFLSFLMKKMEGINSVSQENCIFVEAEFPFGKAILTS